MLRTTSRRILVAAAVLVVGTFAWTMLAQANTTDDEHTGAMPGRLLR